MYKIHVIKGKAWFWKLTRNGRTLAHSEQYSRLAKALKTARNLQKTIPGSQLIYKGVVQ